MKKVLALVLTLMLVLTAVSALANNSKNNGGIYGGDTDNDEVKLVPIDPTDKLQEIMDKITEANDKEGDPLKGLPGEIVGGIPAEHTKINDMKCWMLEGDVNGLGQLVLIFKFEAPYPEGEEVTLLIGIAPADGEVEWIQKTGVANADGDVVVTVTAAELAKIQNNPFIAIPVSK